MEHPAKRSGKMKARGMVAKLEAFSSCPITVVVVGAWLTKEKKAKTKDEVMIVVYLGVALVPMCIKDVLIKSVCHDVVYIYVLMLLMCCSPCLLCIHCCGSA
jgi:uncharacterized membrane protein